MDEYQDEIARIKQILAEHPQGMSITEIAGKLKVNRNSVAKYMDILQIQGAVDGRKMGTSKVYYLSGRMPAQSVLKVCTRPLVVIDKDLVITDTNRAFTDVLGTSTDRIIKQQFESLPIRISEGGNIQQVLKAALRGTEQRVQGKITHATGRIHSTTLLFEPVVFESGKPGIALIIDEYGARTPVGTVDTAFADILSMLDDEQEYLIRYSPDGIIRFVNETYCRAAGKSKEDLMGRPFKPLVFAEDAERIKTHLSKLTSQFPVGTIEYRAVMANGEVRWQRWKNRALFGDRGELTGYQSCGLDITDLMLAQQKLQKAQESLHDTISGQTEELREINRQLYTEIAAREKIEQQLLLTQFAMDNAADMVFWVNHNARVQYANKRASEVLGYTAEELNDIPFADIFPLYTIAHWDSIWEQLKKEGVITSRTIQLRKEDGEIPVEIAIRYLQYHGNEFACCFSRDISENARMEQALQQANKKLNLLTSVTRHDIQNKITVLLGFLSRAKKETKDQTLLNYLERQEKAAKEIRNEMLLTRDFKDLGTEPPSWQNLREMVSNSVARQGRQDIRFTTDVPEIEVYADIHLERVFDRLFENSLRQGKKVKEISIQTIFRDHNLIITVEDDGTGIKPEDKTVIFDLQEGDMSHAGLFIAREILSVTGMTLQETGDYGKGARFEIRVPETMYRFPVENT
ncbi:MAG: sensory histidine kinase AtoS [Methanoregula sp. PtaU1.Bin051]|nr:MAG: sensory histidine kinase AtoS [Methanoregula sp. PtaU1.Bin051]